MPRVLNVMGNVSTNALSSSVLKLKTIFNDVESRTILFSEYNERVANAFHDHELEVTFYGDNHLRATLKLLRHLIYNLGEYDVLFVGGAPLHYGHVPSVIHELTELPLVVRFNGYNDSDNMFKQLGIVFGEQYLLRRSDKIIFQSKAQMEDILLMNRVQESARHEVVSPGIPEQWFSRSDETTIEHLRQELGIGDCEQVIGTCVTPRPVKRVDTLLEITERLSEDHNIKLVIVGDSDYVAKYKQEAKKRDINHLVIWVGRRDPQELSKFYSLFDVTVMTSDSESFGQPITESYLCKTPCVAYDHGGMRDQIIHNETGYLVPSKDVEAFLAYVVDLLDHPDRCSEFAESGREFIEGRYSLEAAGVEYSRIFSTVSNYMDSHI